MPMLDHTDLKPINDRQLPALKIHGRYVSFQRTHTPSQIKEDTIIAEMQLGESLRKILRLL